MDNTVFEIAHYYDKQLDQIYTHHIRFEDNGVSIETL